MAWFRIYIVTLVAFVWLFSTVCFQMCPQTVCLKRGKVALVAFVRLFSTMRFQMCLQIACPRRVIVWLYSMVCFQMCFQMFSPWGWKVTLVAFLSEGIEYFLFFQCIIFYELPNGMYFLAILHAPVIIIKSFIHHYSSSAVPCPILDSNWQKHSTFLCCFKVMKTVKVHTRLL